MIEKKELLASVGIVIPTYNAGREFAALLHDLSCQTVQPQQRMVIDSSSADDTAKTAHEFGWSVATIPKEDFSHGGTRQQAVDILLQQNPALEIVIFMTQDVKMPQANSLEKLLAAFQQQEIGAAYGRQLPHKNANIFASFARLHNYPSESHIRSFEDRKKYGMKAAFLSDSFAAYRKTALEQVGGFPKNVMFGEDMYIAARLLMQGWRVAYTAEAEVYHSHNYSVWQEFKRYREMGRFHGKEKWIRENFGEAEGNGKRFVMEEMKYVCRYKVCLLPEMLVRDFAKFLGYRLGIRLE